MKEVWYRVTRATPCKVCGKPDWCGWHPKFGIVCMRVQSDKPAHNGGWHHPLESVPQKLPPAPPPRPTINATRMMREFIEETTDLCIRSLAARLGITSDALKALGCAWAGKHRAYAFPMRDGYGEVVGIRLRDMDGHKWAVTGSRQGLFWPYQSSPPKTLYVAEGPTDCAAGHMLGLFTVGRPSCSGGNGEMRTLVHRLGCTRAVIIADNDTPGVDGAQRLANEIRVPSATIVLPVKDLREFVNCGGTPSLIDTLVDSVVWNHPGRAYE